MNELLWISSDRALVDTSTSFGGPELARVYRPWERAVPSVITISQLSAMHDTLCPTSSLAFADGDFVFIAAIPDSGASLCLVLPAIFLMMNDTKHLFIC